MTSNFLNTRHTVTETVRLSWSTWEDGNYSVHAVGLYRLVNNRWELDMETCLEFRREGFGLSLLESRSYATKLFQKETGGKYPPPNFLPKLPKLIL